MNSSTQTSSNITKDTQDNKIINELDDQFPIEKYKKKSQCPHFLLKLYQILENDEYKNIIHWGEDGKSFVVANTHAFSEKILPIFFKHNNYSSFIRQLNIYNFHKKKSAKNENIFQNQYFIKNKKDLIKGIKRKNKIGKKINLTPNSNSNLGLFKNINNINSNINNNINIDINNRNSSLSIDEDLDLSNSVHSKSKSKNRPYLPMGIPSSNDNIYLNINNDYILDNYNYLKEDNFKNDINVNSDINMNESNKKITKKELESLLTYLQTNIEINTEKEKQLQIKIERLAKKNEEYMTQNQKMLNEINTKNDYNKKLEAVISFILEMIMTKQTMKNYSEIKNYFLSKEPNKNITNENNNLNNLKILNFTTPKHQINNIFSKNDYEQTNGDNLDTLKNCLNKYVEKQKNIKLLSNKEINLNSQNNVFYNNDNCNITNDNNIQNNNIPKNFINNKRKRSPSLNSILSNLNNETNNVNNSLTKDKDKLGEKEILNSVNIEEKKIDEQIDNNDNSINIENTNNNYDSFSSENKSKNIFDIDMNQEENKSDIDDWNKDLLNISQSSFSDIYIKDNDMFI